MPEPHDDALEAYWGQAIVSKDSFLRRLPVAVSIEDRLRLDGLVLAADVMTAAFATLRRMAAELEGRVDRLDAQGQAMALSCCWTIVDQLFAVRQLIASMPGPREKPGPVTAAFLDRSKPAHALRNKMDHLASNIRNLSKAKGKRSPIFGSLSYFYCGMPPIQGGFMVNISPGSFKGGEVLPMVNPAGRSLVPPVDLFTLNAFGIGFELAPPLAALRRYVERSAQRFEARIAEQVARYSAEHGVPESELMVHNTGGFAVALRIEFGGKDADGSAPGDAEATSGT